MFLYLQVQCPQIVAVKSGEGAKKLEQRLLEKEIEKPEITAPETRTGFPEPLPESAFQ